MSSSQETALRECGKEPAVAANDDAAASMRVVWDMTHAGRIQTGIGAYARNVTAVLGGSLGVDVATVAAPRLFEGRTAFLARSWRAAHQVAWTQFGLRTELWRIKPDIVHAPAFVGSLVAPCPLVVTIHDMAMLRFPEHHNASWQWYNRLLVPLVARRANAVITMSEYQRQEVQRYLKVPSSKMHVTYSGLDSERFRPLPASDVAAVACRYGLSEPFILHVGSLAARKNIPLLLEAVFRLKKTNFWRNRRVVLAGGIAPGLRGHAEVRATIEGLGLERDVLLLGHVPDEDLPALYNLAQVVVMPTLYEGFGLPVVEAMACGRPVVASNTSSIPEVAGSAALLVDPMDSEAWAQALAQVLSDRALRESMIERGLRRAPAFSWQKTAQATLRVYRSVLGADGDAAGEVSDEAKALR